MAFRSPPYARLVPARVSEAAESLDFEKAALLRDQIFDRLRRIYWRSGSTNPSPFSTGTA